MLTLILKDILTKNMPFKDAGCQYLFWPVLILFYFTLTCYGSEGISDYYIRYDIKYTKNKISRDNLVMIPGDRDFRSENFSWVRTNGAISSDLSSSNRSIDQAIKKDALKKILMAYGLKSVKAKDHENVVSYEGAIKSPLNIIKKDYISASSTYSYEVQVLFSPTAFPDRWKTLEFKDKIKNFFHNILELF